MLSNNMKNRIVNALVGRTDDLGGTVYIGLSSTAPNADGTGVTEPSGNGYGRVLIGNYHQSLTQKFGAAENGVSANEEIIYFPESTGSWGATLTHFVLFNSKDSTDPSAVMGFDLLKENGEASPITVASEKTVVMFRVGALEVKCEDN